MLWVIDKQKENKFKGEIFGSAKDAMKQETGRKISLVSTVTICYLIQNVKKNRNYPDEFDQISKDFKRKCTYFPFVSNIKLGSLF